MICRNTLTIFCGRGPKSPPPSSRWIADRSCFLYPANLPWAGSRCPLPHPLFYLARWISLPTIWPKPAGFCWWGSAPSVFPISTPCWIGSSPIFCYRVLAHFVYCRFSCWTLHWWCWAWKILIYSSSHPDHSSAGTARNSVTCFWRWRSHFAKLTGWLNPPICCSSHLSGSIVLAAELKFGICARLSVCSNFFCA